MIAEKINKNFEIPFLKSLHIEYYCNTKMWEIFMELTNNKFDIFLTDKINV